jgi:dimethylhistidine N-methyltransferase
MRPREPSERRSPRPEQPPRFRFIQAATGRQRADGFAAAVGAGLARRPKELDCCYFYDAAGSRLFEEICELPEYYLTRAETEIFRERARTVAGLFPGEAVLVELGSGSSVKTRLLIEAFLARQERLLYVPIDICSTMLSEASSALLAKHAGLDVLAIAGEYREGIALAGDGGAGAPAGLAGGASRLVLWLGSNIGNLHRPDAAAFLRQVRESLSARDRVLLGIDMRKDRDVLERAYDDSRGVTALFNRNILARINRDLDATFDLAAFRHRATYDERLGRVEMHLVSARPQVVRIRALDREIRFDEGETIHTENSYKYSESEIDALLAAAGLAGEHRWMDGERRFTVVIARPA